MTVDILGRKYTIYEKSDEQNDLLNNFDGYAYKVVDKTVDVVNSTF